MQDAPMINEPMMTGGASQTTPLTKKTPPRATQQDRPTAAGAVDHLVGQGIAACVDGGPADLSLIEGQIETEAARGGLQHPARLGGDLGTDPVAGKKQNAVHVRPSPDPNFPEGPFAATGAPGRDCASESYALGLGHATAELVPGELV